MVSRFLWLTSVLQRRLQLLSLNGMGGKRLRSSGHRVVAIVVVGFVVWLGFDPWWWEMGFEKRMS